MADPRSVSEPLAVRVVLRPIGSPLTIGMSGLAVASLAESGLDLRWIASDQRIDLGVILLAVPFVLQLVACIFSYLARDAATGACVGLLATTWLAIGLVDVVSSGSSRNGALGLLLVAAGGILALSGAAVSSTGLLPGAVFLAAAVRFVLGGVYELGAAMSWEHAGGVLGLIVCGLAAYSVLAFELEGQQRRPVLPTFRRGRGQSSVHGTADDQLHGIVHEPGVRQTS